MKSPIAKYRREHGPNLVCLVQPKTIKDEDIKTHEKWKIIKSWYDELESDMEQRMQWLDQASTSVANAIVYQERKAFCITTRTLRDLLANDANWNPRIGLSNKTKKDGNTYYSTLIAHLTERLKLIECVQKGEGKKPSVYKVIDKNILSMIDNPSMEDQIEESLNYANNSSKNSDLTIGDRKGDHKGVQERQKEREIESKQESESENNNCLVEGDSVKKKLITFEQLLFKEYPDSFPSFDDIEYLAQIAVENCEDFDAGYSNLAKFESHLKAQSGGKPTPKQKAFISGLVEKFSFEAKKIYNLVQIDDVELRQPTELKAKSIRHEVNKEDQIQNNTLNVIKSTYGQEKIKKLKARIEACEDERKIREMTAELAYWEKTN